ncbi:hypothetical protein SSX86_032869 [Deinandra increscens subsp. villosa]|uniref:J domain-containing protein n=1 Tax=Deinandra increscens subsp. villosa TaxID=3103831 RepID=A0AAP0C4C4_9ASTR
MVSRTRKGGGEGSLLAAATVEPPEDQGRRRTAAGGCREPALSSQTLISQASIKGFPLKGMLDLKSFMFTGHLPVLISFGDYGNKDEALRCLKIGKDAVGLGDRSRALKFISKAQRLDPSLPVHDLLSNLETDHPADESPSKPAANGAGDTSGVRRRVPLTGSSSGSGTGAYTQEQITIVSDIKRKKDYYEILGLEKSSSVEDIRKAYRKLSLKVHPGKNKAPGSEEAFKKVSKAFQCLSNEESRKQYDVIRSDEPVVYERRAARRGNSNGFYYDGDVDAEEIFRNFFFGGMNPRATTQFTGFSFGSGGAGAGMQAGNGSGGMRMLLQVLPVLLILLLNFLPSNEPVYTLSRTYELRLPQNQNSSESTDDSVGEDATLTTTWIRSVAHSSPAKVENFFLEFLKRSNYRVFFIICRSRIS